MTPTEKLILENQIAMMLYLNEIGSANLKGPLKHRINITRNFIYESDGEGIW